MQITHADMMRDTHLFVKHKRAPHAFERPMRDQHNAAMNIRRIRKARKLSQRDLAEMAGYNQSTIQRAEKMNSGIRLEVYQAIAEALNVTLADLFSGDRSTEEALLVIAYRSFDDASKSRLMKLIEQAEALPQKLSE